jgi:hypothetical protein
MLLRKELGEQIDQGLDALVRNPNDRLAGRIHALKQVMDLIDEKTDHIDNPRPPEEKRQDGG